MPPPKFTNTWHCLNKDLKEEKVVLLVRKARFSCPKLLYGWNELRKSPLTLRLQAYKPSNTC